MKKLLGIVVLSLLICGNVNARIIKLECDPKGFGDHANNSFSTEFWNVKIDTKLKKMTFHFKYENKTYVEYLDVLTMDDQFVTYKNPTRGGDEYLMRFDYLNFIDVQLKPKHLEGWDFRCIHAKDSEIVEKPKKKKPKKKSPDDSKVVAAASGTGFFVSNSGDIITNHHVIEGCNVVKVNFKGNAVEAKTLAIDKVNDIAILKANIKPDKVYSVSNEDVSLLEDVIVAGFPLGKKVSAAIKTHKGVVTALAGAGDNYSNFQTDATINQGNSGGPIMNQKGNIVGIAVATWVQEGVQGVHFGIKSSTLKTFASANGLRFLPPNNRDLSNKELGNLITEGTVYLECHMTIAKIKKMIAEANNRKAFFSEYR